MLSFVSGSQGNKYLPRSVDPPVGISHRRSCIVKCHYPNCTYEGTQAEVDEHLSAIGTDHDWPEGYDQPIPPARAEMLRRLDAAYARGDAALAYVRRLTAWPIDARGCVEAGAHLGATRHTLDECPAE